VAIRERQRHSLKDVARKADVSVATVSRYLNGTLDLPARTRARIDGAVASLGYRPNPHARRLSLGRSDTIALVVPDIANPFFARLSAAMERAAAARGQMVTLHATRSCHDREVAVLELAAENLVDGVVFLTHHATGPEIAERLNHFPRAVVLDEDVPGVTAPRLMCDNELGGFLAGRHLYGAGHRKVAYIGGGGELFSTAARLNGLRRGMDGLDATRCYVGEHAARSGRSLARRFLDDRDGETAIFVGSDELLLGVLEVFRDAGILVPHDVSLVSFDDVRSLHLFDPPITAVAQPVDTLGRRAVELLLDGAWDDPEFRRTTELLPVHLIDRGSVGPPTGSGQKETGPSPLHSQHGDTS
jgi:LacI family transcriptional regulator